MFMFAPASLKQWHAPLNFNMTMHILHRLSVIAFFLLAGLPISAAAQSYFVAPNGDDANPGTLAKPFATLHRARQAARKLAGREAVTFYLREGTYYLPEPLVFTAEDSGTQTAPVEYRAYEQEKPVLSGGIRLRGLACAVAELFC